MKHADRSKIIVLDRDGVINAESPDFVKCPEEWIALPGSLDAIATLTRAGFAIIVATNQSGVGRGLFTSERLEAIHAKMREEVENAGGRIVDIFVCRHHPDAGCQCRKPLPGLFHSIAAKYDVSMKQTYAVGDRESDITAARAAGAKPVLVLTGHGKRTMETIVGQEMIVCADLFEFAARLLDGRISAL